MAPPSSFLLFLFCLLAVCGLFVYFFLFPLPPWWGWSSTNALNRPSRAPHTQAGRQTRQPAGRRAAPGLGWYGPRACLLPFPPSLVHLAVSFSFKAARQEARKPVGQARAADGWAAGGRQRTGRSASGLRLSHASLMPHSGPWRSPHLQLTRSYAFHFYTDSIHCRRDKVAYQPYQPQPNRPSMLLRMVAVLLAMCTGGNVIVACSNEYVGIGARGERLV